MMKMYFVNVTKERSEVLNPESALEIYCVRILLQNQNLGLVFFSVFVHKSIVRDISYEY
jgi:hypothetical protein